MGTDFLGNSLNNFRVVKQALTEAGEETGETYNYYGYIHRSGKIVIMRSNTYYHHHRLQVHHSTHNHHKVV